MIREQPTSVGFLLFGVSTNGDRALLGWLNGVNSGAMRAAIGLGLVLSAAMGCKKSAPLSCDEAAKGLDAVVQTQLKSAPAVASEHVKGIVLSAGARMKAVVATRCAQDKWSNAMIRCVAAATDNQSMSACKSKLTSEQAQRLDAARKEMALAATPAAKPSAPMHLDAAPVPGPSATQGSAGSAGSAGSQ